MFRIQEESVVWAVGEGSCAGSSGVGDPEGNRVASIWQHWGEKCILKNVGSSPVVKTTRAIDPRRGTIPDSNEKCRKYPPKIRFRCVQRFRAHIGQVPHARHTVLQTICEARMENWPAQPSDYHYYNGDWLFDPTQ